MGPGGWNDLDSLEVGNGSNDGLTVPERQSTMTLWSMADSPLILGTNLTHLDPTDLAMLENKAVISVDQDGVAAGRIVDSGNGEVFSKRGSDGDCVIALYNTTATATGTEVHGIPASFLRCPNPPRPSPPRAPSWTLELQRREQSAVWTHTSANR